MQDMAAATLPPNSVMRVHSRSIQPPAQARGFFYGYKPARRGTLLGAVCTSAPRVEAGSPGWKTYYVCLTLEGRKHFKIGVCHGKVANRFRREPDALHVEVLRVWEHPTQGAAHLHEEILFRENVGDRPYFGRCGPLTKGGNGETFSHDVLGGEPPPQKFLVRMLDSDAMTQYTYGYADRNPKEPYRHLHGEVEYMRYAFGVGEWGMYQVPGLSHPDSVTLCDGHYFQQYLDVDCKASYMRDIFLEAVRASIRVVNWSDYSKMKFQLSHPFRAEEYAVWV